MTTKQCNTCKETKPLEQFGVNRRKDSNNFHAALKTQYTGDCKVCLAIKQKAWRAKNPGYWKKVNNKVHTGKISKYPKEDRYLLSAIRTRISTAKRNSLKGKQCKVLINADEMYELWKKQKGICALSGLPMTIDKGTNSSLSIDKIDPNANYSIDNVQWVRISANRAKNDLTMEELLQLCKGIIETCNDYPEREYTQVSGSAEPSEMK